MRSKRAIPQATLIIITTTHTTQGHQLFHCGRTTTTSRITTTADAAAETDANVQREQKRSQSLVCSHFALVVIVLC